MPTQKKNTPSALIKAIRLGRLKKVKNLLEHGAPVNETFASYSPLIWAAKKGRVRIAKELIRYGADVNLMCEDETPLIVAIINKRPDIVALLLKEGASTKLEVCGYSLLSIALSNEDIQSAFYLIKAGCEVNPAEDVTPLLRSVALNQYKLTNELVKAGANVNSINLKKSQLITPIYIALINRNVPIITALLKAGASVNYISPLLQLTPLEFANQCFPKIQNTLVDAGAKSNEINKHIYLDDTIIRFPQKNCMYHIKTNKAQMKEVTVSFAGDFVENYCSIDVANGIVSDAYDVQQLAFNRHQLNFDSIVFITPDSLRVADKANIKSPILIENEKLFPNKILEVANLVIYLNKNKIGCKVSGDFNKQIKLVSHNEELTKKFKKDSALTPIMSGKYPIHLEDNKPEISVIKKIYDDFIHYNKKCRTQELETVTYNLCHLRAHFISELYKSYGIQTLKVYKTWNTNDWSRFRNKDHWIFHCATMIIDNHNKAWVWDPKVGCNQFLPFSKWVDNKNEPSPLKVLITNQDVISDYEKGMTIEGSHFMNLFQGTYRDVMQAMISLTLPNRPQKSPTTPLNHQFSFFKKQTSNKRKIAENEKISSKKPMVLLSNSNL